MSAGAEPRVHSPRFPSLFVSPDQRDQFLALLESPRGRPIWERVWARAESAVTEPLPSAERGGRWAADTGYVSRLGRVVETCALAFFVTGEERFARRGREALFAVLAVEEWVSDGAPDILYGLKTGTISQVLAVGYDFLHDTFSEAEREHIISRWQGKALAPYLEATRAARNPHLYGHRTMNWLAVQTGGLGLALLVFGKADRDFSLQTEIARAHILRFLEWYHTDGSALEWGGYWVYGLGRALNFVAALQLSGWPGLLGDRRDTKMQRTGYVPLYLSAGRLFVSAFGDTHLGPYDGAQPLLYLLAREHGDGVLQWWADRMEGDGIWSLFFLDPELRAEPPDRLPTCTVFTSPQIAVFRDRIQDEEDVVFTLKSGLTRGVDQEAPHAHYDLQSILLHAYGQPLLVDSDAKYSTEFWETYHSGTNPYTSTFAHNTILVNGEGLRYEENAEACIIESRLEGEHPYVVSELLGGYGPRVQRFVRSVVHVCRQAFLVLDDIALDGPGTIDWLLHYAGDAQVVDPGEVMLTNESVRCRVMLATSSAPVVSLPGDQLVPYLKWTTRDDVLGLRLAALIQPYRAEEPESQAGVHLTESGVDVTLGARTFRWCSGARLQEVD